MTGSNFPFIKKPVLRQNLDDAFEHIVTLLPFAESSTYNDVAKSSFRKTIIIYTASIIEALLFHIVDTELSDEDLTVTTWKLVNKKTLHDVDVEHQIVAGDYNMSAKVTSKETLNLALICGLLKDKKILSPALLSKVDVVRKLRNSQHIGPDKTVKSFSKKDLENAFAVASEVKSFVSTRIK
jgi:hypothetical protein